MKYKTILLFTAFLISAIRQKVLAQQVVMPAGHAKLEVTPEGKQPKPYLFLDNLNYSYNCMQSDDENPKLRVSTEIVCQGTFKNGNGTETLMSVNITIEPSGVGTFIINPDGENIPFAHVTIDFNDVGGPMLMALPGSGNKGKVIITNYPSVGGNLTGTFQVRMHDESDKKSGYYNVTGEFNVRRVK